MFFFIKIKELIQKNSLQSAGKKFWKIEDY